MDDRDLEIFLDSPPFLGKSSFANLQQVKTLCGETGRIFCREKKCWGTSCLLSLQNLIVSNVWQPLGISPALYGALLNAARRRREANETAWLAAENQRVKEAREKAEKQEKDEKARRARLKKEAERDAAKKRAIEANERAMKDVKVDPRVGELAVKLSISLYEAAQILKRGDVVPTKNDLDECHALGFTQEAISHSMLIDELGPRMTLSPHGRVLRWCHVLAFEARCDAPKEVYFNRYDRRPYIDERLKQFANELNNLGGGAQTPILLEENPDIFKTRRMLELYES